MEFERLKSSRKFIKIIPLSFLDEILMFANEMKARTATKEKSKQYTKDGWCKRGNWLEIREKRVESFKSFVS